MDAREIEKKMELNEREKGIVDLIDRLAAAADDDNTAQETIDHIMAGIREKSKENVVEQMNQAKEDIQIPRMEVPKFDEVSGADGCGCGQHESHVNDIMLFTRIREVKSPTKAHPTDAGIDFFVPDAKAWNDDFKETVKKYSRNMEYPNPDGTTFDGLKFDGNVLEVSPNAHVAIPSGIKTIIPQGLAMMMVNKSGVATKLKLDHSACLIDSEYRDELIFCFFNHNVEPVKIEPGMKITQGLIVPVIDLNVQEVLNCVYDDIAKGSDRGGGFGSSGTK